MTRSWVTEKDPEKAQELEARWHERTDLAKAFAVQCGGRFKPLLPHVVAEIVEEYQRWLDGWKSHVEGR